MRQYDITDRAQKPCTHAWTRDNVEWKIGSLKILRGATYRIQHTAKLYKIRTVRTGACTGVNWQNTIFKNYADMWIFLGIRMGASQYGSSIEGY
ncbi:hypothetical protein TWF132_005379 [Orbilia oligospora]|nr:hypothetical protein TWF132_005379 [Orbilia oligospora]